MALIIVVGTLATATTLVCLHLLHLRRLQKEATIVLAFRMLGDGE